MIEGTKIVLTREFAVPKKRLWEAWTEKERIEKWWGPKQFTTSVDKLDFKENGKWKFTMHGPDGKQYPSEGIFLEIEPVKRIVSTDEFGEEFPHDRELPKGIITTVVFNEENSHSIITITIQHTTIEDRKKHEKMQVIAGWNSMLDCLEEYVQQ